MDERVGFQELFGLVDDFRGVSGEHALIKLFNLSKRRRVAEDDIEERQPLHVPPEHDKTETESGVDNTRPTLPHNHVQNSR